MIHVGDCLEVLPKLDASSVDSIVTDPPYGLGFMGKAWDHAVPGSPFWAEMLRVAKPGAFLTAFGGTRAFHRMACAIEDAGWELRDTLMWVYGSGFPKSHNGEWGGTALKPAWEPIVLARKPLIGTVEANWREHGTGALNIDACRVFSSRGNAVFGSSNATVSPSRMFNSSPSGGGYRSAAIENAAGEIGRWPANLVHDGSPEVVSQFPAAAGAAAPVRRRNGDKFRTAYGAFAGDIDEAGSTFHGDSGSAARFFYCAKASRKDRNDGCAGMEERPLHWSSGDQSPGTFQAKGTHRAATNNHPTVKPTELMRWLCRLVTPRGGVILDPFMGSGSTGRGARAEGFEFVGIEIDPDYARIAKARILAMGGAA